VAALGKIGVSDDKTIAAMSKCVVDDEPHVRRAAISALQRLKPDPKLIIPTLLQVMHDAQPDVAMSAMAALSDMGEAAVPALVDSLSNKASRHWAAVVLAEMGPKAAPAATALANLVKDPEPEVRMQALIALGQIGGTAVKPAIPAIIEALQDSEPAVRYGAAFALGKLRAQEAADALDKLTKSDDATLKLISVWAVARIHPDDAVAIRNAMEAIAEAIRSEDPQLSRTAARALAEIDGSGSSLTPAIKAALDELDPTVIEHVMEALAMVGAEAVPVLTAALTDEKARGSAVRALGQLGPTAKSAAPGLTALLSEKDNELVSDAALALAAIGPDAAKAVPSLAGLLSKEDPGCRYAAVLALGRIGPTAKSTVPALQKQISKEPLLAIASVWAIKRIDPTNRALASAALPVLTKLVTAKDEILRVQAAGALGDLGPEARDAVPLLKKMLDDPHEDVRKTAADALAKIQGTATQGTPPSKAPATPGKAPSAPSKSAPTKGR
jgi:HEAT repeat protein